MSANLSNAVTARPPVSDKYRPVYADDLLTMQQTLERPLSGTSDVVGEYESKLATWFDAQHAIAVSSGGAALSVAIYASGVGPGDDVLLTPSCPLCTIYPIIAAGANPIFVDTRSHGFGADPASIKARITPQTKAIIDIPMWGYPSEVDELHSLTQALGIKLILDLAHSHGTTLNGQPLSRFGDISCFSTHE
ncbi:DegT/DnrJ/EryC1/StrS family aminotransferase, partial [Pseudomonas viridiflava]